MRGIVLVALALSIAGSHAVASTVKAPTLRQMVERADRIFVGEVTAVRSYRTGAAIHTDVTFRSTDSIKGPRSAIVMLTFLGGTVDDVTLEVEGMPQFAVGDEQVVFATDRARQISPIVGVWHGRVKIARDPSTRAARVLRHDGTPFERAAAVTEPPLETSDRMILPISLEAFLAEVRQLAGEPRQ